MKLRSSLGEIPPCKVTRPGNQGAKLYNTESHEEGLSTHGLTITRWINYFLITLAYQSV